MAVPTDPELKALLEQFVCVRIVQMYGLDLRQFAFDGVQTWLAFLMNADGTIYGRYGSRSKLNEDRENSVEGFKAALRGALALHRELGADPGGVRAQLAGKLPKEAPPWPRPESIPTLQQNERFQAPFSSNSGVKAGCIHCHMVPQNEIRSLRASEAAIPDRHFFPYPLPRAVGMHMDPSAAATVRQVRDESPAAAAGVEAGDRIVRMEGQPILSTADLQWVLHHAADADDLELQVKRGTAAELLTVSLALADGWRRRGGEWRFTNPALLRQILGFNVKEVPAQRAQRLGLESKLAFTVDRTDRELRMASGLGNLDLIVAIDDRREPMTLGDLTAYVAREKPPGSKLKVTVMQITDRFPRPELSVEVTVR